MQRQVFQAIAPVRPFDVTRPFGGWLAALLVALLAGGCARFQSHPISPDQAAAEFDSRTLADDGLRAFLETNLPGALPIWPLPAWHFTNLTLAAFYYHPDLDVARAKWSVAEAGKGTAGQRPNPTLSAAPAYNPTTTIPSPWLATVTLDIPIETAGKRGYRMARAGQLSEAARWNLAATAWQVRSRLHRAWVDLCAADQTETLLSQQQAAQAGVVRLMEAQLAAGAVSPYEVTQARLAASRTRLAWQEAQGQREEARARLAMAIGVPSSALEGVRLLFADLDGNPADLPTTEARRQALLSRADLLAALADYAASESALQLEIARQYPDLQLSPGYKFNQGDNEWSLGLSVTLPLLHQNQGPIAEAEARRAEAEAQFNALQARVIGEVDRALAAYRAALGALATAEAMAADLGKQDRAARARWEYGDISKLELSNVQLELNTTALARATAWVNAQHARGDLEDALQTPVAGQAIAWETAPRTSAVTRKDGQDD
jgi:outer membrane protein TolC